MRRLTASLLVTLLVASFPVLAIEAQKACPSYGAALASSAADPVSALLAELNFHAREVQQLADSLWGATLTGNVSLPWHVVALGLIREHINQMGALYCHLNQRKASALPWQRQLIERAGIALHVMARQAQSAIEELNQDRVTPFPLRQDYRYRLANIYLRANQLNNLATGFLELARLDRRTKELREKLGVRELT